MIMAVSMAQPADFFQALSSLPHGGEFRFIDELTALEPGVAGSGRWTLKGNEEFLRGHFPGQPLMPGVLMIEALAQLGGILFQTRPGIPPLKNLRLTAVRQVKIFGSITPGQGLEIHARLEAVMGALGQVSGEVRTADGAVLLTGVVALSGEEG